MAEPILEDKGANTESATLIHQNPPCLPSSKWLWGVLHGGEHCEITEQGKAQEPGLLDAHGLPCTWRLLGKAG